jgi:hypothetical protein
MDRDPRLHHHDSALCDNPNLPKPPAEWSMFDQPVAINHVTISMSSRKAWLKQLAWLRAKGVEVWGDNIQGAIDYAEGLPTEADEAFIDDTNYPIFGAGEKAAE